MGGAKAFDIYHPLDPAHKYLNHASVESLDMKNFYDGLVALDQHGEAVVELPNWFEALNKDFWYQLTAIGTPGPGLYIAEKVRNNRFKIAGGAPGMEVTWQVTGVRQDAFARANPMPVEQDKPAKELGTYLHPQSFGQPEEKGYLWVYHADSLQSLKELKARYLRGEDSPQRIQRSTQRAIPLPK